MRVICELTLDVNCNLTKKSVGIRERLCSEEL